MKTRRTFRFRPDLSGAVLEDRVVLSNTAAAQVSGAGPLAQIHAQYIQQFQLQYASFSRRYADDVTTLLLGGTADQVAAQRPAFDAQVLTEVDALADDLASLLSLSPLAQKSGLTQRILQSLGGNGTDSLISRLDALPTPTDTNGASAGAFGTAAAGIIAQSLQGSLAELDAFFNPANPMRQGISSPAPTTVLIRSSYDRQFQRAFADFATAYTGAVSGSLLGDTAAAIAGNRAAFDAKVLDAANALQADLVTMLGLSPRADAALSTQLQQLITGSGPDSLVSRLNALPTPTDVAGSSAFALGTNSSQVIDQTFRQALSLLDRTLGHPAATGSTAGAGTGSGATTSTGTGSVAGTGGTSTGTGSGGTASSSSLTGNTGGTGGNTGVAAAPTGTVVQGGNGANLGGSSGGQTNGSGVGNSFIQGFFANNGQGVGAGPNLGVGGQRQGTFNSQVFGSGVTTGFIVPVTVNNPFLPTSAFNAGNFTLGPGFLGAAPRVFGVGGSGTGVGAGTGFNPGFGSNAGLGTGFNFGAGTGFGSNAGLGLGFSSGFGSGSAANAGLGLGFGSGFGGSTVGNNAGLGLGSTTFSPNAGFGNPSPFGASLGTSAGLVTGPGVAGGAGFGGESGVSPGGSPGGPATPPVQAAPVGLV